MSDRAAIPASTSHTGSKKRVDRTPLAPWWDLFLLRGPSPTHRSPLRITECRQVVRELRTRLCQKAPSLANWKPLIHRVLPKSGPVINGNFGLCGLSGHLTHTLLTSCTGVVLSQLSNFIILVMVRQQKGICAVFDERNRQSV